MENTAANCSPTTVRSLPVPIARSRMANGLIWDDFEDDVKTMLQKYLDKKYPLAQATPEYYLPAIQSDIQSQGEGTTCLLLLS